MLKFLKKVFYFYLINNEKFFGQWVKMIYQKNILNYWILIKLNYLLKLNSLKSSIINTHFQMILLANLRKTLWKKSFEKKCYEW